MREVLKKDIAPFGLRMDSAMRDQIAATAKANGRSMNSEIIARLSGDGETLRDKFAMDARLIAAAPEMLAALRAMDDFWTSSHPAGPDGDPTTMGGLATLTDETLDVWRGVRAAIAKAEGKSC
jgi:hypothetical protein